MSVEKFLMMYYFETVKFDLNRFLIREYICI